MGFKSKIRNYQIKKLKANSSKSNPYHGFDSIKTMGIIFERSNAKDVILEYGKKMESLGKKVVLLEFLPFTKKEIEKKEISAKGLWYCKSDLKFSGQASNSNIDKFLNEDYQVHLDLNTKPEHPNDFISLKTNANLKAGGNLKDGLSLDLMLNISEKDNFDGLFKELDYYLNFINQKKK